MNKIQQTNQTSCPDDSAFIGFFNEDASFDERERLLDHILVCPKCRLKFETISELHKTFSESFPLSEAEMEEIDWKSLKKTASQKIKTLTGKRPPTPTRKLIFASTFLLLCVLAVMVFRPLQPQKQISRGGNPFGLALLEPRGIIHEPPSIFRWTEVAGSDGYNIKIFDDELKTIFSSKSGPLIVKTKYMLEQDLQFMFTLGKTYVWVVEAFDDFENVITSESANFTIRKIQ